MPLYAHDISDSLPPAKITCYWGDEPVTIEYQPEGITPAWRKLLRTDSRQALAELLVSWDVLGRDGQPWQPTPQSDTDHWEQVVHQADQLLAQAAEAVQEAAPAGAEAGQAKRGRAVPEQAEAPTEPRIRAAYVAAWKQILDQLGNRFVLWVVDAIVDDFVGGK
jgi:hypothetical protein